MKSVPTPISMPIRVLLMSNQAIIRAGLRMLIESQPGLVVVGEATNSVDALAAVDEQPNIIILDSDLNGDGGLDFLPKLREAAKGARVLILTDIQDLAAHQRAVVQGAMGLVLKEKPAEDLIRAIRKVHAGEVWLDRAMMANVLPQMSHANGKKNADPAAARSASLTDREREVAALIGEGLKNKQIAERLFISETTVRHHLTSIFDKLGVADRCQLVIYSYRHNLTKLPH